MNKLNIDFVIQISHPFEDSSSMLLVAFFWLLTGEGVTDESQQVFRSLVLRKVP